MLEVGIRLVHLISGEDLVGKLTIDTDNHEYILDRAVRPNVNFDPQQQRMHVGLLPANMFSDKDTAIVLKNDHVLWIVEVSAQMQKPYNESMTGLSLAGTDDLKQILKG